MSEVATFQVPGDDRHRRRFQPHVGEHLLDGSAPTGR